jgi:hypothetical protein
MGMLSWIYSEEKNRLEEWHGRLSRPAKISALKHGMFTNVSAPRCPIAEQQNIEHLCAESGATGATAHIN